MSRNRKVAILGIPSDLGANIRGACMGPAAIRISGLKNKIAQLGYEVHDFGDIDVPIRDTLDPSCESDHYLKPLTDLCSKIHDRTLELLEKETIPIFLGGDHSIAIGSIAGVSEFYQKQKKNIGIVWIDAHADINTPHSSPSGNIHGMPLAVALGQGHPELVGIGHNKVKVRKENVVLIGIRTIDGKEKEELKESGIRYYTMRNIDEMGMFQVMQEAIAIASNNTDGIHLSFDLDGIDPRYAPGVSTPVSGGLSFREAHLVLEMLYESNKLSSMDFVELNPWKDEGAKSSDLIVDLIQSALGKSIV